MVSESVNKDENETGKTEGEAIQKPGETPPNPLSKNQLKKQRKAARFEEIKKERRLKERERQRKKRQEALALGLPTRTGPSRKELKKRQQQTDNTEALSIAIDLDYDDLMQERDVAKCIKQCLRIYTINRRSPRPAQIYLTGLKRDGRIHGVLKKNDGWENWHVKYCFDQTHVDVFPKAKIVYLTCESDRVLEKLETEYLYVIGGLVDHNHQKGLCHERATNAGIQTVRLPLSEHVDMKTRAVLSTYHVFEILLRVAEGKTWTNAILETIPMRKGAKPKETKSEATSEQEDKVVATETKPTNATTS